MVNFKILQVLLLAIIFSLLTACASNPENLSPDLDRGLVAHWSMDQSQLSGTTLKASVGSHDGLLVGKVSPVDGRIGGALELDGETGYITFGNILNDVFSDQPAPGTTGGFEQAKKNWSKLLHLDGGGNQFSISIWIKPVKLQKNTQLLVKSGNSACNPPKDERQFALLIGDGSKENNRVNLYTDTLLHKGYIRLNSPKPPPLNEWTHIVFNYDESVTAAPALRFGLYLNGVKQPLYTVVEGGDSTYKVEPGIAPLAIGQLISSSGPCARYDYFAGAVDDLRIYDRLLSSAEAKQLAQMGSDVDKSGVPTLTVETPDDKTILVSVQ